MSDEPTEREVLTASSKSTDDYSAWLARMQGSRSLRLNMLILNVLGFLAHLGGALYVVISAGDRFSMKVALTEWSVNRSSDSLQASNQTSVFSQRQVHAYYVRVAWCVMGIHLVSMLFHLGISVMLAGAYLVPGLENAYLTGLYKCRAPWRWLEYSISATLMIFITVILMGVRDVTSVYAVTSLCFVVQLFGWMTEVHSSSLIDRTGAPKRRKAFFGLVGPEYDFYYKWQPNTFWDRWLWHHLLGYIPFCTMWWLILDSFYMYRDGLGDLWPGFMDYVVWGSIGFFTLFGVTQFLQQWDDYGPSWYPTGEASYVALSFLAKVWIGVVITWQMIADGAQWDDTVGATF